MGRRLDIASDSLERLASVESGCAKNKAVISFPVLVREMYAGLLFHGSNFEGLFLFFSQQV